jgi:hypothetical protein
LNPKSLSRTVATVLAAVGLAVSMVAGAAQAATPLAGPVVGADNPPQAPGHQPPPSGHPAPDQCLHWQQLNPDEQRYRTTNNVPFVYTDVAFGLDTWFDVICGDVSFTIPAGQEALVDLSAVAELDCGHAEGVPTGGWCGGRFLVNGQPLPHPDNTNRADPYAWDSATGGPLDYQAHALEQEYHAICQQTATGGGPCFYRVQLQSRLEAGAKSVWIDDLTMRADVSEGPVSIV